MAGSPAMPQHGHPGAVLWPRSGHLYREDNSKRHLARKILVSDEIEFTQVHGAVPQHLPDSLLRLMFTAPVFGANDHNERLPVFRYKLGNPFRRILGHGRKTLLGCLELTNCHNTKKVRHSVLSVQNLKSASPFLSLPPIPARRRGERKCPREPLQKIALSVADAQRAGKFQRAHVVLANPYGELSSSPLRPLELFFHPRSGIAGWARPASHHSRKVSGQ